MQTIKRVLLLLTTSLLVSTIPACSKDETSELWSIPVDDGGYALVRVDVPGAHDVRVRVTIEDARRGETYYLLFREERPPRYVGWFDASPYSARADRCDDRGSDDWCDPIGAGRFVERRVAAADGAVELVHEAPSCWKSDDDTCPLHYAILSEQRIPTDRRATMKVTTKDLVHADPAKMQLLH